MNGQNWMMSNSLSTEVLNDAALKIYKTYQQKENIEIIGLVKMDVNAMHEALSFIDFPGLGVVEFTKLYAEGDKNGYEAIAGKTDYNTDFTVTSKGEQMILKYEEEDNTLISILPIQEDIHIITKSKGISKDAFCGVNSTAIKEDGQFNGDPLSGQIHARNDNNCKTRLLVTFTDDAVADIAIDLHLFARNLITEANTAFINSDVSLRFELAAVRVYNVNESLGVVSGGCRSLDLDRYFNNVAPYNFIDVIRENYRADLCLLMISDNIAYPGRCTSSGNPGTLFGQAIRVGTDAEEAYSVASLTAYEDGRFTVIHEIGHSMGAAHDDGSGYRRGFLFETAASDTQQRRTIMCRGGVGNCTLATSCRVHYFSNPDIQIGGNDIGVEDQNDNARWLEEQRNTIRNYRENPTNLNINATTLGNNILGNYTADNRIRTNGNVICNAGGHMNFRAGSTIEINNGFTVNSNAEFAAI
ncbi:MAG: M12 family metallo-peptidase, partial [Bacteroidota bacterium]